VEYLELLRTIERGAPPPLALLHGADPLLLDDALALATRALFRGPEETALGREVFDGAESTVEAIVRSAQTLPLMTGRRLVAVRRCQGLPAKGGEALAAYAGDPNEATCLLLLADEPLGAGRARRQDHWLLGAIPPALTVRLTPALGRALEAWLRQRAAAEGLGVSEEAARLLVEWVGEEGASLLGEVRKAALAGGPDNTRVGVAEVEAIVGQHRVSDVFELTRAVERRDAGQALRLLDRLLATEEPVRLLALLVGDARTAWGVAELSARGQSVDAIARALRRPPRVIEAIARATAGAPQPVLARRLARCWQAERRLKSSGEPRAELAALVADLCVGA
jgi:DNA polymerase-3 subunit delta